MRSSFLVSSALALAGGLVACGGAGRVGEAVRPNAATGHEAMGEAHIAACAKAVAGEPLVVDLKSNERSDLEVAMRDGVVVVGFDCRTLKILKSCSAPGSYRFAGVTRKEDVVRMTNADELAANLPLTGASLSAGMKRGSTLDLALVTVGKKRATASEITKPELAGGASCAEATHVVRGVYVGAFALATGTEGEARAVAQIFGAGTAGASSSAKKTEARDGDIGACRTSTPDSAEPPAQCAAITRLELVPLVEAKKEPNAPKSDAVAAAGPQCPSGFAWDGLKCVSEKSTSVAACSEATGTVAQCQAACDAGSAASCFVLGFYAGSPPAEPGKPRRPVERKKTDLAALLKGCTLGSVRACQIGASVHIDTAVSQTATPAEKTVAWDTSFKMYDTACSLGDAVSCRAIAEAYDPNERERGSTPKSMDKKFAYLKRGCDLGSGILCGIVGDMHRDGKGAKEDSNLAIAAYERQCTSGGYTDGDGCYKVGAIYANGKGVPASTDKALAAFERACGLRNVFACMTGYNLALEGKDTSRARAFVERGCTKDVRGWDTCQTLGDAYEKGKLGLQKDYAKAAEAYELGCANGGCGRAGDLYKSGGPNLAPSPDKAIDAYAQGCNFSNDAKACTSLEAALKLKGKKELVDFYTLRCENRGDARACVKLKAAGGTPKEETINQYAAYAKARCQKDHYGDECKLWKDLGGTPTAAELAQPTREAQQKKADDERKKAAAKKK